MYKCNVTSEEISSFMNFGSMPSANAFLEQKDFFRERFYDLKVGFNKKISLFQLVNIPTFTKQVYKNYPFFTHKSKYMVKHFNQCAKWLIKNFLLDRSNIIEIGSNDGTMLKNFKSTSINALGVDPSINVARYANSFGVKTIPIFFTKKNMEYFKKFYKKTKVIFAANVFCHVKDLVDIIFCVDYLLEKDGYFIFEEPYLGSMYKNVSYDQLYDEHIYMFSITSIKNIFELFDFTLLDALEQKTHGGSMRYIVTRKKNKINSKRNIDRILKQEDKLNISNYEGCLEFRSNCEKSKELMYDKIVKLKKNNKKICGYAATAKSTTILNYCSIGPNLIDCIYDTSDEKIGKFSPGMHIPIKSMNDFNNTNHDYAYLFAWNHKKEIFSKEKKFISRGGKWMCHVKI